VSEVSVIQELTQKQTNFFLQREQARQLYLSLDKAAQRADMAGEEPGRKALAAQATAAKLQVETLDAQIRELQADLDEEKEKEEKVPLERALALAIGTGEEHLRRAERIQKALAVLRAELPEHCRTAQVLHQAERRRDDTVTAMGRSFHPLNLSQRLRGPLAAALDRTRYTNICRPALFRRNVDFLAAETAAVDGVLSELKTKLDRIRQLERVAS
jgi:hypothetical protein